MQLKLHYFSFLCMLIIYMLEECEILTPKIVLIKLASAEISNGSCSYVLRNYGLKCGNNFGTPVIYHDVTLIRSKDRS